MTISALPTAPSPADTTSEFNSKAFAFLVALDGFGTEANALAGTVSADAADAAAQVSLATDQVALATDQVALATTQVSLAADQVTLATTQAGIATTKSGEASGSAAAALVSEQNAAASYDAFDDRYLGSKTSDPTLDNDGNALLTGAIYWNSVSSEMLVWSGSVWAATYLPAAGYVSLTGSETLTNKTIDYSLNTLTGVQPALVSVTVSGTTQAAATNNHYILTNVAATTVTLPASPASGDTVWVTWANSLATNIIARNAQTIMGAAEDMTLDALTNGTVQLRFVNSDWRIL